jgi:hypothetical protein
MNTPEAKPNGPSLARRATDAYIYVMLTLFPLFTGFRGYADVTRSKFLFFAAVTALWLILLLAGELAAKRYMGAAGGRALTGLMLIYMLLCTASAVFSEFGSAVLLGAGRFDGLLTSLLYVSIFLGVSRYARPKERYIYAAVAAVSLNCAVAVLQMLGFNPLRLFPADFGFYDAGIKFSGAFYGTIGNADLFSAHICLLLPLLSVFYIITDRKRPLLLLPAVLLCAFCLFECGVSAGMTALAVTALAAPPFVITDGERLRRALEAALTVTAAVLLSVSFSAFPDANGGADVGFTFGRTAAVLTLLGAVLIFLRLALAEKSFSAAALRRFFTALAIGFTGAGLITVYFWRGSSGTVYELSRLLHGEISDAFGSSRILIWRKTLETVPERPFLGGGPGTLALRLNIEFSRFVAETGKTLRSFVDNAHNVYLGILADAGLFSLLAYLAAQALTLSDALRGKNTSPLTAALACALLCFWIQDFFGLGLFLVSPLMWILWGLSAARPRSARRNKAVGDVPAGS